MDRQRASVKQIPLTILIMGVAIAARIEAQTPAPQFDVASIRINREVSDRPTLLRPILQPGGRVLMRNQSLSDLIRAAYGVNENQLIGGPSWVRSTGFDLEARGGADISADIARAMLRALLAERFSLQVHREQRTLPIYELTVTTSTGQRGSQLRPAAAGQCAALTLPKGMPPPPPPPRGAMEVISLMMEGPPPRCPSFSTTGHLSARAITIDSLATRLAEISGRPVANRTRLNGEFDLDLTYTPALDALPASGAAPELTTALREQLGLKLEASRGPVGVLVIDRAMMPNEN